VTPAGLYDDIVQFFISSKTIVLNIANLIFFAYIYKNKTDKIIILLI